MVERHGGWHADAEVGIEALPEVVWAIVSDISRHPALASSGEVLAVRMNGPVAVGTTFESDVRTGDVGSFSPMCHQDARGTTIQSQERIGKPDTHVHHQGYPVLVAFGSYEDGGP